MATNSIYNNITVRDKKFCESLVNALEDSKGRTPKNVMYSKKVEELDKDQIRKLFGDKE